MFINTGQGHTGHRRAAAQHITVNTTVAELSIEDNIYNNRRLKNSNISYVQKSMQS